MLPLSSRAAAATIRCLAIIADIFAISRQDASISLRRRMPPSHAAVALIRARVRAATRC